MNSQRKLIGSRVLTLKETTSTNDEARHLARSGYGEGTAVVADIQTKGRGRNGRKWVSPEGGLYLSIIIKPYAAASKLPFITLMAAVAVLRALRGLTKLNVAVKWPNDIVIESKKAGGILCEASAGAVIVGIGLNLNTSLAIMPKQLKKQVTSLKFETGSSINKERFLSLLFDEMDVLYRDFLHGKHEEIADEWKSYCHTFGRRVNVITARGAIEGIAEGMGKRGELIVRGYDGKIKKIMQSEALKVNEGEI